MWLDAVLIPESFFLGVEGVVAGGVFLIGNFLNAGEVLEFLFFDGDLCQADEGIVGNLYRKAENGPENGLK